MTAEEKASMLSLIQKATDEIASLKMKMAAALPSTKAPMHPFRHCCGKRTSCYRSQALDTGTIRFYKCKTCGQKFRTFEEGERM